MQDEIEAPVPVNEADEASGGPGRTGPTWVEELAGPDDYWLTLTDAARVTRRQEVTIRRWVAAGTLSVRNRPLGLNKRTRHVRAIDHRQHGLDATGGPRPVAVVGTPATQIDHGEPPRHLRPGGSATARRCRSRVEPHGW